MAKKTVNIDDKKSKKAKQEHELYLRLKRSFLQIKLHQEGKIQLKDAREFLSEL